MNVPRVIVVGSVNEDLVVRVPRLPRAGETVTGGRFARFGGGKGANAVVAAVRLGAEVLFVGAVGADEMGETAIRRLAEEGLDVSAIRRLEGESTGVALIVVGQAGENQIAVASGANAGLDARAVEEALADRDLGDRPGVLLANLEVPDAAILAGARAATAAGWRFVLDPAPARPVEEELLRLGPILTPNEGEARALSGADDLDESLAVLMDRTGAPVVLTLGSRGALVAEGSARTRIPAPEVEAADATGAGDVFDGVLAARLAAGASLLSAAAAGVAAASLSTTVAGARGLEATPERVNEGAAEILRRAEAEVAEGEEGAPG